MATSDETRWVSDEAQLHATVEALVSRGGVVQGQSPGVAQVQLKKRQITVRVGSPPNVRTERAHWYDEPAVDGAAPGTVPPAATPSPPLSSLPPPPVPHAPPPPAPGAPPPPAPPGTGPDIRPYPPLQDTPPAPETPPLPDEPPPPPPAP